MQTILGSGGTIGIPLAKELSKYTDQIRLVSRHPKKVNHSDELFAADLSDPTMIDKTVQGSTVVYMTIGFPYRIKIWRKNWPALMNATIEACKKYNSKLVFFDNVYLYDREFLDPMTEETPVRPSSKKGKIRAEIANMLMKEVQEGKLEGLIARAADFIAPTNSILTEMVYKNLQKDKKADWFASLNKVHNFTFSEDAGRATALLGNTPDAFNQVWHLPSIHQRLTGKEWIDLFASQMKITPKYRTLSSGILGLLGIFIPILKEFREMIYQYDRNYFFDSSKFENRFGIHPVTAEEAVKAIINESKG